jgi:hypothetical protein
LREALPDKIISYTFPGLVPPFREVVYYAHELLDTLAYYSPAVNAFNIDNAIQAIEDFGVPRNKIVWGVPIGCNKAFDVSVDEATAVADKVKSGGYAGVVTWSINRDTDHRSRSLNGDCTQMQTGLPDGTYNRAIGSALN